MEKRDGHRDREGSGRGLTARQPNGDPESMGTGQLQRAEGKPTATAPGGWAAQHPPSGHTGAPGAGGHLYMGQGVFPNVVRLRLGKNERR